MVHIWFPRKKWRTGAWHIHNKKFKSDGYLIIQYCPSHDQIGVETGKGHLQIYESWPSFRYGQPSEEMPEREALKLLEQIEADCDKHYKRANDRHYDLYRALGEEYTESKPYREHPLLLADNATVLEQNASSMKPLHFNAAAESKPAQHSQKSTYIRDDRTWRTEAYLVEQDGYPRPFKFTTFCEIRVHPDREKEQQGLYQFVTWRMGENSVYCNKDDASIQRCLEIISYFEYEHRNCKKASPVEPGGLALPVEYFNAADYHDHPHFHPEDVTTGRQVTPLKTLKLKPK